MPTAAVTESKSAYACGNDTNYDVIIMSTYNGPGTPDGLKRLVPDRRAVTTGRLA